ncbi:MAG: hypothetical protein K8F27_11145 [Sulfuricellaceae bacterium]|nr:hypothetical protein [Sulfuricellaceae bacterium]
MIRNPIDVSSHVSPQLSALIESRVNDPDAEQAVTLSEVRAFLAGLLPGPFKAAESFHRFDIDTSILDELDALIEEYGGDRLAVDFVQTGASEPLSRVIEAVVNDENREYPPTLATVRDAMASGLLTRLVGEGVLDEDEDDTLQADIDALIGRFGADALAEGFLRYE